MKRIFISVSSVLTLILSNSYSMAIDNFSPVIKKYPKLSLGVYFEDISNNSVISNNPDKQYTGASTTKVLTAITVIKSIENNKLSFNSLVYKNGPTVKSQINLMINDSDNNAWANLNNLVGWTAISDQAKNLGMNGYNCNGNLISPKSDELMLKKLYTKHILNSSDTSYLLSLMQNTNDESLIPPALPKGATIYHKYGWLNSGSTNVLNDTAIIYYQGKTYYLSIYTDSPNHPDYQNQVNAIHDIVKALFKTNK